MYGVCVWCVYARALAHCNPQWNAHIFGFLSEDYIHIDGHDFEFSIIVVVDGLFVLQRLYTIN